MDRTLLLALSCQVAAYLAVQLKLPVKENPFAQLM